MDGYLVVGRCGMDDVPLRLFASEKPARDYASTVTRKTVIDYAMFVYGIIVSQVITVVIVPFLNGIPQPHIDLDIDLED